ncbi:Biofilm operon icaADBC HTH-type negative transcriptional regulator IcaR [Paraliobacillus sp. PM-2]|uniref:TetR/AcrR family transcriptional regulator n=1 Tax=Paraliobacillus sp. PM-2 TaxID=1462524 RepID=UPI00061BC37B|nr:TetR/AcrR family transcriptional regulator [Paraliobacillus sp. PM-2]CQR45826.1 Biofilm operon icaADBC HTH-type negative transcriptional regulator IcaR [Paraliobacillus sp. PM-2]
MSYQLIKDAALDLFATYGYEGTSLADIAKEVGIKKQSIYAHFKGKDDLFLQVLKETFSIELKREDTYLRTNFDKPLNVFLWDALQSYMYRFHHDNRLNLWLRNAFLPPSHLYKEVIASLYDYIDQVEQLYLKRFQHAFDQGEMKQSPGIASMAFSALLDAIGVEMVYGGDMRASQKLYASWQIFWVGISNPNETSNN